MDKAPTNFNFRKNLTRRLPKTVGTATNSSLKANISVFLGLSSTFPPTSSVIETQFQPQKWTLNPFRVIFFALSLMMLAGCKEDTIPQTINEVISKADGGSLQFSSRSFRPDKPDFVKLDASGLKILQNLVDKGSPSDPTCPMDGKITLRKGENTMLTFEFSVLGECNRLAFEWEGQKYQYPMRKEARDKLLSNMCQPALIAELAWMNGTWGQAENDGSVSYERWQTASDALMAGLTFSLGGNDTLFSESTSIALNGNSLEYLAKIEPQKPAVAYKVAYLKDTRVLFENKSQDFPQFILYQLKGSDTLHSRIEGLYGGHPYAKDFYLVRKP